MYADRRDAGETLATAVRAFLNAIQPHIDTERGLLVAALPRGGVPVGAVVARSLGCPLDVIVARKLGAPAQPELAMGAIARVGGVAHVVRNESVIAGMRVSAEQFER